MQRILILCRAFSPCHLTAAARANSFAAYLGDLGYYPIVITRNWDLPLVTHQDIYKPSGSRIKIVKSEKHEVHYIPFKGTLSYRPYNNRIVKRLAGIVDAYFGDLPLFNPHYKILNYAIGFVKSNRDIKKVVVSAPPFCFLDFGFKLNCKFGINWIADYRDEWNTEGNINKKELSNLPFISRIILRLKRCFYHPVSNEIKWLGSAASFMTVSPQALLNISSLTKTKGSLLINGFDQDDFKDAGHSVTSFEFENKLTITYAGCLYATQQIEVLTRAVARLAHEHLVDKNNFQIIFIGGAYFDGMQQRIQQFIKGMESLFYFSERVSKKESIEIQKRADILLMCAHKNNDAIPSSKLYEYIGLTKAVLLCPSDHGIMEQTLKRTRQAIICNTVDQTFVFLKDAILNKQKFDLPGIDRQTTESFSRKGQITILAKALDDL